MRVIYPGTFDPITNGHIDIVKRALSIFDNIIVAVAENPKKECILPYSQRIELVKTVLADDQNVEVYGFGNLLIDFAQEHDAHVIIRGLRTASDFEYEFQLIGMNRQLSPDIETIFLTPSDQYAYVSSTLVKEIALLGGNIEIFVPPIISSLLQSIYQKGKPVKT